MSESDIPESFLHIKSNGRLEINNKNNLVFPETNHFYAVLGSFQNPKNALKLKDEIPNSNILHEQNAATILFKVMIKFDSKEKAIEFIKSHSDLKPWLYFK
ncbi:MAG: hypothetical protein SNJ77_08345 [Cytophagales bacterium]